MPALISGFCVRFIVCQLQICRRPGPNLPNIVYRTCPAFQRNDRLWPILLSADSSPSFQCGGERRILKFEEALVLARLSHLDCCGLGFNALTAGGGVRQPFCILLHALLNDGLIAIRIGVNLFHMGAMSFDYGL